MKKIFLCTTYNRCDNNGYLTTQLSNYFVENNIQLAIEPEDSDCIVFTTCGFDQDREDEALSIINSYIIKYSDKEIIVSGCLAKINPELFQSDKITLIGNKELDKFDRKFKAEIKIQNVSGSSLNDKYISREYGFVDSYYLQICQGCVNNCSYCAIKTAKGHVASKPIDDIVLELKRGYGLGYKRFMLLGDDCGSYGVDIGVDLADLLNRLNEYDIRLVINYIEPGRFMNLYPKIDSSLFNKIDFMNIPVQATSKRVLGLMNRHYDPEQVMDTAKEIKRKFPNVYLETHVIFGFPGETRDEFRDSLRLAECFDEVIFFCYTDRKNVKSASFPGKLSTEELKFRANEIIEHPKYCSKQNEAKPPFIILGNGLGADASQPDNIAALG